jgi:hypothetical protein
MPAPFLFSSVWPYQPAAIAVLVYLQFTWGSASPPLSGGACLMSVTVASLPLSKHAGGGYATPAFSGWLVYLEFTWGNASPPLSGRVCHMGNLPSPLLWSSGHPALFATCLFFQLLVYYAAFCFCFCFFLWARGLC